MTKTSMPKGLSQFVITGFLKGLMYSRSCLGFCLGLCLGVSISLNASAEALKVGAEQFDAYVPLLSEKRVALVVNQSALVPNEELLNSVDAKNRSAGSDSVSLLSSDTQHLLDALLTRHINVISIMSPEHGFRGDKDAGEKVDSNTDMQTGLPIHSLYGKTKKPSAAMLENIDTVIFDIQDVGVRFYTYLSTLHYVIEAAFEQGVDVIVLDRPNPNIAYVDGPLLSPPFKSSKACQTNFTPSLKEIINLVILLSVIVRVPLFLRDRKKGITDPRDPITLPYLTTENFVGCIPLYEFPDTNNLSEVSLVAP